MSNLTQEIAEKMRNSAISFKGKMIGLTDEETLKAEVDLIAAETGWSEHEILRLPTLRRKSYVSMIREKKLRSVVNLFN